MPQATTTEQVTGFAAVLAEAHALIDDCEAADGLNRAEALLQAHLDANADATTTARAYALLAAIEFWRHDYAPEDDRAHFAEKGANLAAKAIESDPDDLYANAWSAALMGIWGLEQGVLSILHYIPKIAARAERTIELDETYNNAMGHQVIGNLYRLSPPKPIGIGNKRKALAHLERARELAPTCPDAKLSLGELLMAMRKKDRARAELQLLVDQDIALHGPAFAARKKAKARELLAQIR